MSCYLRHCGKIMEKAGVTPSSKEERRKVDMAMREIVGLAETKCPEVWKEIKKVLQEPDGEERLVTGLRHKLLGS
ncbi:hypothetical protein SAMN05660649_03989 [Desulfotomaculum arcticum]|uniref:Uncharacterized protein n=1 Tax=Desulfotruncus arcticus DSM 17038 TaxID=1121424 RepID=A0A1I2XHE7_9FIRM|nr:hypothetical protein [Desulfotruncus arcticus]SFH12924.1 hypothetical protein SAMN05660649_03989 [Desulfotomaculum arcticum] [Desulfotruncus arcticus DSM 17038]